ncbi:amino acid-binding protein [Arthrobacter sp. MYb224]|uniref:ABC transporter substrate-binding protein n=1 Tax=Arthrobacter sp. MYb224 TaxID=1848600 RepID=UPI000CFAA7DF|nr:ABC transporter substrate-binding protein [Arthrobacter sp. MYb224]PQZ97559.1 amino acid-binding protein [Arthrobacter sp. MYb224]
MSPTERGFNRRSFLRYSGAGLLALAAAPALASCASRGTDATTLRLGAMYPVSGTNALLGEESWRGVQIATDLRNAGGGVAGKQIEMVFADVPDVNTAASEARRLVFNKNIKLGFGTYSSSLALAATEVFARTGNAYVELGAVSEAVTTRGYDKVFRLNPTAADMTGLHMDFIQNYLAGALGKPVKDLRVMMLHEDSSYGQSIVSLAKAAADKIGLQHFEAEPYSAKSTDLSSTVLRMKSQEPDIVLAVSYAADAVLLGRQIRDNNVKLGVFVGTGGGHSLASFQKALGDAADGVFDVDFTQIHVNRDFTPGIEDFISEYHKRWNAEPASGHSLSNFTGAQMLFDILETTGGNDDPEVFAAAARKYHREAGTSAAGWGYELDAQNQNQQGSMYVMQWSGSKLETVYPPEAAVRAPKLITPFGL